MAVEIQRRRGSTAAHAAFMGALGETTFDTTLNRPVVHDGATAGGFPSAMLHLAQTFAQTQTFSPAVNTEAIIASGFSLTGASAQSLLDLSGTWNTTASPAAIKLNVTNTASGASATLLDLQRDGLSRMTVRKSGFQTLLRQEADTNVSGLEISKRGTTGDALGALSNGSGIGGIDFRGYDGVAFAGAGNLRSFTTQSWAAGAHGSSFVFSLVPNGSTTETAVATLTGAGALTLTGQLLLPNTTSATVGGIYFGGNRAFHNFGTNNIFSGALSGNLTMTGAGNSFFGVGSGTANTTGANNSFFGFNAGLANTTGGYNSFFGSGAGFSNTTGIDNSFFGRNAGRANTTGVSNSFFGSNAGTVNTTGTDNSFFGINAGVANTTGTNNSFFGRSAGLANTTGTFNCFFGVNAGLANTTGTFNCFFGVNAGRVNTTGSYNSFFGLDAGRYNTTAANNSFFGRNAGRANTTGVNNTFFGFQAGDNVTTGSNNLVLGYNIDAPVATTSNQMSIGNLIFGTGVDGTGVTVSSGNVGIAEPTPLDRLHIVSGGHIRLGNAAVASGILTNTHTVTIKDSAGVVYRLLCLV